jgi:hypothetical protein
VIVVANLHQLVAAERQRRDNGVCTARPALILPAHEPMRWKRCAPHSFHQNGAEVVDGDNILQEGASPAEIA